MEHPAEKDRTIRLWYSGADTAREITLREAQQLLEETYSNRIGGLVLDAITRQVIWEIGPDVQEILVVEVAGGG